MSRQRTPATTVSKIQNMKAQGFTGTEIAQTLNKSNIFTVRGRRWNVSNVFNILNPAGKNIPKNYNNKPAVPMHQETERTNLIIQIADSSYSKTQKLNLLSQII